MTGPLEGVKVVDLTANMSGPYATMILAEQGADVIKIEPPGGDIIRRVGSGRMGMSAYFENLNHGKRSVVVDLRSEQGVEVVRRLTRTSDVLVQNFRPGIIERLGLGAEALRYAHRELIYVSITGYGRGGPLAETPAYDHVLQAMTGMAALQADPRQGVPSLIRHGVVDKATGLTVAQAVSAALFERMVTGEGNTLDVAMLDVALHFFWPDGMMDHTCLEPVDIQPPVSRGFRLTKVADGFISLVTVTDVQWEGLINALGLQERFEDPDLRGTEARMRNGGRVMREVAALLERMDAEHVVGLLRSHGVPCMRVAALEDVAHDAQVLATGSLIESEHPVLGQIIGPRSPARFAARAPDPPAPASQPGADTDEVLYERGYSQSEIAELRSGAVIV